MSSVPRNTPAASALTRRSRPYPPMIPGTPEFGAALPSEMQRPRSWPRLVSTTQWQSVPAAKPGPTPMTIGASVMEVPVFTLAITASTSTSGFHQLRVRQPGSTSTAISSRSAAALTSSGVPQSLPVIPSTAASPSQTAVEKATVRRTVVGCSISVIAT